MKISHSHWLALAAVSILLRLIALGWNDHPWGDMTTDASVTRYFAQHGHLGVDETGPHYYPLSDIGYRPADQRPPGVPWLAGHLNLFGLEAYAALKFLGLLAGLITIPLTVALARRLWPNRQVAVVGWAVAMTYFLVDNSANGNLYMIQAAGILATLVDYKNNRTRSALWLGLTYLVNYQSSFLWFALLADMLIRYGPRKVWSQALPYFSVALLIASPLFVRNIQQFGNPFFQINSTTFANKSGVPAHWELEGKDYIHHFDYDKKPSIERLKTIVTWTIQNIGYTGRQLLFIAGFFMFGLLFNLAALRRFMNDTDKRPVLLGALAYAAILMIFPIVKYRFLILLVIFVLILGTPLKRGLANLALLSVLVLSFATGEATSWGPTYYSGALTDSAAHDNDRDFFKRIWKAESQLATVIKPILNSTDRVMSTRSIHWLLNRPTIMPPHSNRDSFTEIYDHYQCDWLAGWFSDPGPDFDLVMQVDGAGLWRRH